MDTRQVHEYPDSTVLAIFKMVDVITTLSRKLLEKQRVFASYEQGSQQKIQERTDGQTQLLNPFVHAHAG